MDCEKCGTSIKKKGQHFCPSCGNHLSLHVEENNHKKRNKLLFVSIMISLLLVGFIVLFLIGKEKFNPEKTILAFETAIANNNVKDLLQLLSFDNQSLTMNKEDVENLLVYFSSHPENYRTLMNRLHKQADHFKTNKDDPAIDNTFASINLKKAGKKWILFHNYQLAVIPAYIRVESYDNHVDILINGEKVDEISGDEGEYQRQFGPFVPGIYTLKAVFDNNYVTAEQQNEIELFQTAKEVTDQTIELKIGELYVESTFEEEATLYIDDKKTDIIVNHGKQSIGPFPLDKKISLQLHKKFPWGDVVSDKIMSDETSINFSRVPLLSDNELEEIMQIVNDVFIQYTEALSKKDDSLLQRNVTEHMKEELQEKIKNMEANKPNYEGTIIRSQFKVGWFKEPVYHQKLDTYIFVPDVMFTYYEPKDNLGKLFDGENKHEYMRAQTVTLLYNEDAGQWQVDAYKNEHFFVDEDDLVFELNNKP